MLLVLAGLGGFIVFYMWLAWPGLVAKQANSNRMLKWLLFLITCGGFCLVALLQLFQMVQHPYDCIKGRQSKIPSAAQVP